MRRHADMTDSRVESFAMVAPPTPTKDEPETLDSDMTPADIIAALVGS
jgi:hypothetical protein